MAELARKTPSTLRELMDKADDFVNADDTLQALLEPRKQEVKSETKNQNSAKDKKIGQGHQDERRERYSNQREQGHHLIHNNLSMQEND